MISFGEFPIDTDFAFELLTKMSNVRCPEDIHFHRDNRTYTYKELVGIAEKTQDESYYFSETGGHKKRLDKSFEPFPVYTYHDSKGQRLIIELNGTVKSYSSV